MPFTRALIPLFQELVHHITYLISQVNNITITNLLTIINQLKIHIDQ
jgi:hypothetical protein